MESGVHASLHRHHQIVNHQIVYAKLKVKSEYHPLYKRLIWDYKT